MTLDTITALATSRGRGAISIVRLSGPDALEYATRLTKGKRFTPRQATLSRLYDPDGELIDECLVIYFKNPKSFTGEDVVEFQLHGGDAVAMLVLDALMALGARAADPGEFSKRAFLNGKIDLTRAEAIAGLIDAKSKESARLLARQLTGELKAFVDTQRDELVRLLAHSEVMIDYADEDIPDNILEGLISSMKALQHDLRHTLEASRNRDGFFTGYKVAIVGKPNVGKSSLLNALLAYERAIVSEIAGTTRDTVEENIILGSHTIKIVDTAGIRESGDAIEAIGIGYSKKMIEESDIILSLFDGSRPLDSDDRAIIDLVKEAAKTKPLVAVINKTDLPQKIGTVDLPESPLELSCREDITPLKARITEILDGMSDSSEQILISKRQIERVEATLHAISEAFAPLERGELEIFSFYINEAIASLSAISRPYEHAQMLDEMFGNFCLGK